MTLPQTRSYQQTFALGVGNKTDRLSELLSPTFNGTQALDADRDRLQPELLRMMEERLTAWFGDLHVGDVVTLIDGGSQIEPQTSIVEAIHQDGSVTLTDGFEAVGCSSLLHNASPVLPCFAYHVG